MKDSLIHSNYMYQHTILYKPAPPIATPTPDVDGATLVGYLSLVNRVIDGLCNDSHSFDRFTMALSALDTRPPPSITSFPNLFEYLRRNGKCGPSNLGLLESVLISMNRQDLVRLLQVDPESCQATNHEHNMVYRSNFYCFLFQLNTQQL